MEIYDRCVICSAKAQETHHLLFGSNHKLCDEDKIVIRVCRECHNTIHRREGGEELSRIIGQALYEIKQMSAWGDSKEEAQQRFLKRYGRNYL